MRELILSSSLSLLETSKYFSMTHLLLVKYLFLSQKSYLGYLGVWLLIYQLMVKILYCPSSISSSEQSMILTYFWFHIFFILFIVASSFTIYQIFSSFLFFKGFSAKFHRLFLFDVLEKAFPGTFGDLASMIQFVDDYQVFCQFKY